MSHDMNAVFARAKGPRTSIQGPEDFPCPWCTADCIDAFDDNPVTTCASCNREFVCPDEDGELVCVGLISPADAKYQAWLSHQSEGGND